MHTRILLLMGALHFVIMFILMYAMVDVLDHVYLNINNLYMAAIMTAPMLLLEAVMMRSMYKQPYLLNIVMGASAVALVVFFISIRQQSFVQDEQFLRSMIPHHSGAILMCERATLQDAELQELCQSIIESQQAEIDQMEEILGRM